MKLIIYKSHRRYTLFEWREFPKIKPKDNALVIACNNNHPYGPQWMAVYHAPALKQLKGMETIVPPHKYCRFPAGVFSCDDGIKTAPEITHWFPIIDGPPPKSRLRSLIRMRCRTPKNT